MKAAAGQGRSWLRGAGRILHDSDEEEQRIWQWVREMCVDKSRPRAFLAVSMYVLLGGATLYPQHAQFNKFRESALIKFKSLSPILRSQSSLSIFTDNSELKKKQVWGATS